MISSETGRLDYVGDGSTTVFPYTWKIFSDADLQVVISDENGVETVQVLNTDYTVTGVGNEEGGNVVFGTAPANGYRVVIFIDSPILQETDLVDGQNMYASTLENALDRLTNITKSLQVGLDRAVKMPAASQYTDITMPLPEANYVIGWGPTGAALTNLPATYIASSDFYNVANYASLAAAVTDIGSTKCHLIIQTAVSVTSDLTVPDNITLWVRQGGLITVTNCTLTIGSIEAGPYEIFTLTGTGAVSLALSSCPVVFPEWFGADSGDITDALTACLASCAAGARVVWAGGDFTLSSDLTLPAATTLEFHSKCIMTLNNCQILFSADSRWLAPEMIVYSRDVPAGAGAFKLAERGELVVKGIYGDNDGATGPMVYSYGVDLTSVHHCKVCVQRIYYHLAGIQLDGTAAVNCNNNDIQFGHISCDSETGSTGIYFGTYCYGNNINGGWIETTYYGIYSASTTNINNIRCWFDATTYAVAGAALGFTVGNLVSNIALEYLQKDYSSNIQRNYFNVIGRDGVITPLIQGPSGGYISVRAPDDTHTDGDYTELHLLSEDYYYHSGAEVFRNAPYTSAGGVIIRVPNGTYSAVIVEDDSQAIKWLLNNNNNSLQFPSGNKLSFASAAPTSGAHKRGDMVINSVAAASQPAGWMCVTTGTFTTYTATGTTTNGSDTITSVSSVSGIAVGDFINASAGFPSGSGLKILALTSNTITVDQTANSSGATNLSVTTPAFKAMANLAA